MKEKEKDLIANMKALESHYADVVQNNKRLQSQLNTSVNENEALKLGMNKSQSEDSNDLQLQLEKRTQERDELITRNTTLQQENNLLRNSQNDNPILDQEDAQDECLSLWKRLVSEILDKNKLLVEKNDRLNYELETLKNSELETLKQRQQTLTYSGIMTKTTRRPLPVVITTKAEDTQEVVEKVRKVMVDSRIRGNLIENDKGKIVINGPVLGELDLLKKKIGEVIQNDKFDIVHETLKKPRFKITNIEVNLDKNALQQDIANRNNFPVEDVHIVHVYKSLTSGKLSAIMETTGTVYQSIMETKKVFVGWQRCPVYEDHNVNMCYNCCGYNHSKKMQERDCLLQMWR